MEAITYLALRSALTRNVTLVNVRKL